MVHRSQDFLVEIAQHCKKLVHLELYGLVEIQAPEKLDNIIANCPHLRIFHMTRGVKLEHGGYLTAEKIDEWKAIRPRLVATESEYSPYP